jgi:hypothetical protein
VFKCSDRIAVSVTPTANGGSGTGAGGTTTGGMGQARRPTVVSSARSPTRQGGLMFVAILGDRKMRLPADWKSGDRRIEVTDGSGPEIQLKVWGLFSDVKVTDR